MKFPQWSEERLKEMAEAEAGCGPIMACSPETLADLMKRAKTDAAVAWKLHWSGMKLSQDILDRWRIQ